MQVNPQIVLVIFNQTLKLTENGLIELKNRSLYSDSSSPLDGTNWIVQSKIYKPMKIYTVITQVACCACPINNIDTVKITNVQCETIPL